MLEFSISIPMKRDKKRNNICHCDTQHIVLRGRHRGIQTSFVIRWQWNIPWAGQSYLWSLPLVALQFLGVFLSVSLCRIPVWSAGGTYLYSFDSSEQRGIKYTFWKRCLQYNMGHNTNIYKFIIQLNNNAVYTKWGRMLCSDMEWC